VADPYEHAEERWKNVPGRFCRCYGELGKGVGAGDNSVSYSQIAADSKSRPDQDHQWFDAQYTSGSDYSGSLVERSNYEALLEKCGELEEEHGSDWYQTLYGGHRTYAILFHVIRAPDEIVELLKGLEDYPLIDEERESQLEMEAQNEAWENWGRRQYKQELEKLYKGDADKVSDEELDKHFEEWREHSNTYWVNESGSEMYIDIARILKEIKRQDGDPPAGFVFEEPSREDLARLANEASRASRRGGAPNLSAESSRSVLIDWLVWNDPNGTYRDADMRREGYEPMSLEDAWQILAEMDW
jgi:hypothetical protein